MTSLYGAGHANAQTASVFAAVVPTTEQATTTEVSTLIDSKAVEMIVRKEFKNQPILVEIARCESTFRHYDAEGKLLRGKVDSRDVGVMQINTYYHGATAEKLGIDLYTIEGNLEYAKYLYDKNGLKDWRASSACWRGDLAVK